MDQAVQLITHNTEMDMPALFRSDKIYPTVEGSDTFPMGAGSAENVISMWGGGAKL